MLYEIFADKLKNDLDAFSEKMPTISQLVKFYKVSTVTMNRALQKLRSEKVLFFCRGRRIQKFSNDSPEMPKAKKYRFEEIYETLKHEIEHGEPDSYAVLHRRF